MTRVAFIGLGNMGAGMAARLLAAGHSLTVYNRSPVRTAALTAIGAASASTPAAACAGADAIFAMTADDDSSRATWLGEHGALAGSCAPGALAIECSTLSHDWVIDLAGRTRTRGLRYIDCPVTGLPAAAAAGELTMLVGAAADDLHAAQPLLAHLANRVVHFGDVGNGTVYKLMINLVGAVQIASAAEGLVLAERAGLDLATVVAALEAGQAASPQVVRNTRRMAAGDHDREVVFTPALRLKDVEYALRLADSLHAPAGFGRVAADLLRRLCAMGGAGRNESAVIEAARGAGGGAG